MAANSKFLSVGSWFKKVFQSFSNWWNENKDWCGKDTEIKLSFPFPDIDFPNKIFCWFVVAVAAILLIVFLPEIFTGLTFIPMIITNIWTMFAYLANMLKTLIGAPLTLLYSVVQEGINLFIKMFTGGAIVMFGAGSTVSGITGVDPDLVKVIVANIMVFIGLEMWHYYLVDRETLKKTPTYRIFYFINGFLRDFKQYMKDFLPTWIYVILNVLLFPIEGLEMLVATLLGFIYYLFDKAELNSN